LIRGESCVILLAHRMKRLLHVPVAPGRIFSAWVCLLAVLLLWVPMWAAAWQAGGMACCNGGMCPAHRAAKTNHAGPRQASAPEAPMDCEHHSRSGKGHHGMMSCSMSCCHESSHVLAAAVIFVLPEPAALSLPMETMAAPREFAPTEFVRAFEPPFPPPRTSLLLA